MEADVNFCTSCGTDLRNVPVDGTQRTQDPAPQEQKPVEKPVEKVEQEQVQQPVEAPQQTRSQQAQRPSAASETMNKMGNAIKNIDRENLAKWFTTSWKEPSADVEGEKWYGIVTLLLEMIVFAWTLGSGMKNTIYQQFRGTTIPESAQKSVNQMIHGITLDVFLLVLIGGAGIVVGSYLAYRFVYGKAPEFFTYVNRLVHLSNINVFLVLALGLIALTNLKDMTTLYAALANITLLLFLFAGASLLKDNEPRQKDYFYGIILYLVIVLVVAFIAYSIVKGQMVSQFRSYFGIDISKFFDLNSLFGGSNY